MPSLAHTFTDSAAQVAALGDCAADILGLDDAALLKAQSLVSAHRRQLDLYSALVAGEISHRSRRDLGGSGLAQREGFATPESLIQMVSGATRAEAVKFVSVGSLMAQTELAETEVTTPTDSASTPWEAPLVDAVLKGVVSVDAVESIRRGLGDVDAAITQTALREATERLVEDSSTMTSDQLYRHARDMRDALDADAVARREKEQHDQRYFRAYTRRDGMVAGSFLYGPEDGAFLLAVVDGASGPKRGGPRFVDPEGKSRADSIVADTRTPEQLNADAFLGIVRIGAETDPQQILGATRPSVRVIVTKKVLETGTGHGHLENSLEPVSIATVERHLCDSGILPIEFDPTDQSMNVGRNKRLFQYRQRIALAVRDGGCMHPECDRPASWTEAHHIKPWASGGNTDLNDGILFCRKHHLDIHNNGWQVIRDDGSYWLKPPKTLDRAQKLIELRSKNPVIRELRTG
jgi:hypothetical protein